MIDISFKLTLREYTRLQYALSFRKPVKLTLLAIGIISLLSIPYLNNNGHTPTMPLFALVYGLLILTYTFSSTYIFARRSFLSNKMLQQKVAYRFSDDNLIFSGNNFTDTFDMNMLYKVQELKEWFLLYVSNANFIMIPKRVFSDNDTTAFHILLNNLPENIKKKLS